MDRIQYKDVPGDIFGGVAVRNELVFRVQPGEAIYAKVWSLYLQLCHYFPFMQGDMAHHI